MYLMNIFMGQECMGYKAHELSHNPPRSPDEKIEGQRSDLLAGRWNLNRGRRAWLEVVCDLASTLHSPMGSLLLSL